MILSQPSPDKDLENETGMHFRLVTLFYLLRDEMFSSDSLSCPATRREEPDISSALQKNAVAVRETASLDANFRKGLDQVSTSPNVSS